jgi:hypothetical protein
MTNTKHLTAENLAEMSPADITFEANQLNLRHQQLCREYNAARDHAEQLWREQHAPELRTIEALAARVLELRRIAEVREWGGRVGQKVTHRKGGQSVVVLGTVAIADKSDAERTREYKSGYEHRSMWYSNGKPPVRGQAIVRIGAKGWAPVSPGWAAPNILEITP